MRPARLGHLRRHGWSLAVMGAGLVLGGVAPPALAQDPKAAPAASRTIAEGLRFGNALLRDRRYDLAADQFERFLKTNPVGEDLADARFGLGRSRLFLNDYPAARQQFEEFLRIAPRHPNAPTAAFRAGESAYLMNDLSAARKLLTFYVETYPDHMHRDSALPELGDACFKLNDLEGAKAAYEKSLAVEPKGRLANRTRFFLGRTLAGMGQADPARKVLDALAEANDPEWSGKARLQTGQMLLSAGRSAEAAEIFAAIERDAPAGVSPEESRLRRAEALIALGKHEDAEAILVPLASTGSRVVAPPAAYMLVGSRIDRSLWVEAQQGADAAIVRVPDSPWVARLLYRSAEAAVKEGKIADARARFLKVANDYPRDAWAASAMLRAARLALDTRDPAGASAIAAEFPAKFPGNALNGDARLISSRAALALDRPADAVTILETLIADEKPGTERAQAASYSLSLAYKAAGQPEKALALMQDLAKSSSPAAADAKLAIGLNQFESKQFAESADSLQAYLTARPSGDDAARALAYLALARKQLGQNEAAQEALDRLAKDFPQSDALVRSRLILAESALEAKRFDEAAALFVPVAESDDPKWKTRALSGLGWAQLQGGQAEKAAATFGSLLSLAPMDPLAADAALARARALEAAGKVDEALSALDVVSQTYANAPEVQAAKVTRARLLARTGKAAEAADDLGTFLRDHPKTAPGGYAVDDLLVEWGWTLHDAGKPSEADAAFRRVLDEFPESPRAADARVFLAESLHAAGKASDAETLLGPVVAEGTKADPELIQSALLRLGKIALARNDAAAASARFERLLRDFPDGKYAIEARFGVAESELKGGKAESAEARFAELSQLAGSENAKWTTLARVRRVQCLVALERWDEALKESDVLVSQPDALTPAQIAEVHYARGRALFVNARFDDALAAYEAATLAAPGSEVAARSQFMRGETYFHDKKYQDALREFHKTDLSYQAPEWQSAALFEAGKVYEALGRWTDAVDVYMKFLTAYPNHARNDEVKGRLAEAKARTQTPPQGE